MNGQTGSEFNRNEMERKKIVRSFTFYCLGIFLFWSAFVSLFNLQSSINIKNRLGMITVATSYFVSATFSIFGVPVMVKKFGPKKCLIIGDAILFPFILANMYPRFYTLLPAGILMTLLQCAMWPSMSLLNILYATWYSTISKRPKDVHVISFSGYFFTAFQSSQVFGNLVSYIVLYGFDHHTIEPISNCTKAENASCADTSVNFEHCGANDCQNATIINESIHQYKPVNQVSLYVLFGITLLFEISAVLIHVIFAPNAEEFDEKVKKYESEKLMKTKVDYSETDNVGDEKSPHKKGVEDSATDAELVQTAEFDKEEPEDDGLVSIAIRTTVSVFKHIAQPRLLLLFPLTFYNGLAMGFAFTELTRAYASCFLGVQWVGICMACFGVTDAILSWVVGKFGRKVGRIPLCFLAVALEIGNYISCLMLPTEAYSFPVVVGIFLGFGVTDGIFQTFINVTHIDHFPKALGTTLAVWNMIVTLGFSIGYALSTTLCVRTRIYINLGVMGAGAVGLVFAE